MHKFLLSFCCLILCFGCSVGPDYKHPEFYSNQQIAENLNLHPNAKKWLKEDWYKDFGDETLNKLIEQGIKNSPTITEAIEKMKQARYQLSITQASLFPFLDASGQYAKTQENVYKNISSRSDYYLTGLDASWELDIWGGQRRLVENAQALLRAAAYNYDNVKLSLTAEIAAKYISWHLAKKQQQIVEKNLALQREIYETVKKQYLSGLTDTLAYEQSLSVLHTSEMQLPLLKTQEKQAKNALAVLVGILPSEIAEISNNILSKQIAVDKELIHSLPVDIINNRPDVQIAEQQLIAQNALIGEALSNLFPQISLSYLFGYQNQNLGLLINKDHNMYSLNSGITLPLFHWGALTNQIDLRKSQTEQALSLYKATLLTAVADISNTQTSLLQELKRNNSTKKNVRSATEILTLSRRKYKNGLTDFSDVLTAEQNKLSAEQTHLQSNADIYLYQIAFYKSVGGGINFNHSIQVCRKDDKESACVHDKD